MGAIGIGLALTGLVGGLIASGFALTYGSVEAGVSMSSAAEPGRGVAPAPADPPRMLAVATWTSTPRSRVVISAIAAIAATPRPPAIQ